MDEQSGKSKEEEVMGEVKVTRKWMNQYQNEVDEEIQGADFTHKIKHNERSDQIFFREDDVGGRARVTTGEELVLRGR